MIPERSIRDRAAANRTTKATTSRRSVLMDLDFLKPGQVWITEHSLQPKGPRRWLAKDELHMKLLPYLSGHTRLVLTFISLLSYTLLLAIIVLGDKKYAKMDKEKQTESPFTPPISAKSRRPRRNLKLPNIRNRLCTKTPLDSLHTVQRRHRRALGFEPTVENKQDERAIRRPARDKGLGFQPCCPQLFPKNQPVCSKRPHISRRILSHIIDTI